MNFIGNKLIPATLFAAAASVAVAAPAQSMELVQFSTDEGGSELLSLVDNGGGSYTLDWGHIAADDCTAFFSGLGLTCPGDSLDFQDVALTGDGTSFSLDLMGGTDALLVDNIGGSVTDYYIESLTVELLSPNVHVINFAGFFDPDAVPGIGGSSGFSTGNIFSDTGVVTAGSIEVVPTPAAVLPILTGLFGAASRKKNEEEEA